MIKKNYYLVLMLSSVSLLSLSCQKEMKQKLQQESKQSSGSVILKSQESTPFELNVRFFGEGNRQGHLKFRQNPDAAKIIELDIKLHHLQPNREYFLQRAVDAMNVVDGNCTSTGWLTLGKGLAPQSIMTEEHGKGTAELWRDVTSIPSGSTFDIHFRVIDALTSAVVLTSNCHQYQVR